MIIYSFTILPRVTIFKPLSNFAGIICHITPVKWRCSAVRVCPDWTIIPFTRRPKIKWGAAPHQGVICTCCMLPGEYTGCSRCIGAGAGDVKKFGAKEQAQQLFSLTSGGCEARIKIRIAAVFGIQVPHGADLGVLIIVDRIAGCILPSARISALNNGSFLSLKSLRKIVQGCLGDEGFLVKLILHSCL